jgi:hypothetical protein
VNQAARRLADTVAAGSAAVMRQGAVVVVQRSPEFLDQVS